MPDDETTQKPPEAGEDAPPRGRPTDAPETTEPIDPRAPHDQPREPKPHVRE